MKFLTAFFVFLCIALASAYGQPIAVSEYLSTASTSGDGEWTELIVLDDVVDIRSVLLTDNNSSQTAAQGGVRFRNIDAWRYLRKGTIIVIHHRDDAGITEDTDPSDGYLELKPTNMTYVDTIKITASSFYWTQVAMNIASGGDILELLSPSDVHIHSLSHRSVTGTYYNTMSVPKPNYGGSISPDNTSIAIAPGATLAAYADANGAQNLATPTQGLPNSAQNQTLWRTLREPDNLRATTMELTASNTFTSVDLEWFASPDTRYQDNTTGYLVLRNTTNSFTPPTDGTTYAPGATLGTATVVANVISSIDTLHTDDISGLTVPCNGTVYYRVYPFRYGTDNPHGNSFNTARGRAYNTNSFASGSITKTFPGAASIAALGNLSICPGNSVVLEASPVGTGYQWFKDSSPLAGATNQTFEAVAAGSYTVRVTAPNGCTADAPAVSVTLKPAPTATIDAIAAQCFRNNSFSFSKTGSTGPGVSFQWNFGTGATPATSSAEAPTGVSYSSPGDKVVTLTVTLDGCTTTATRTVRINPTPSVSIAPVLPICVGDSVRLVASSADGDTYTWAGPNLSATNIANPWAKPTATAQYTVTVQNSATGCSTSHTVTVTVNPKPRVRVVANGPTTVCLGETITLSDDATSGGGQYVWLPDFQSGPVLNLTTTKVGTFIYRLVLTNGNGCKDTSNAITVTVQTKPDAAITADGSTTVCPGGKVTLKANSLPGASYKWSNNATTPEISVGRGTYTVTVSLGSGCDSTSLPITITERAPAFSLAARSVQFGDLGACESSGERTVTITNSGTDDLTFVATSSSADFVAPTPFLVRSGRSTTATLRFTPTAGAGSYAGTIYFTANPCAVLDSIRVEGSKVGSSDVALSLTSVVFPTRLSCNTVEQDTVVTIHNAGVQTLRVLSVGVTAPFTLTSHTGADFPVVIAPSTSATFRFRFSPAANGTATADAVFRYESGVCKDSLLLPLSGAYHTPELTAAAPVAEFAPLLGCEDFRDTLVVVTNTGSIPVTVQTDIVPADEFTVLSHSSPNIAPGEQDTIRLRFRPSATGVRQSTLTIAELLCGTTTAITLRGTKQGVSFAATNAIAFAPMIANCSATGSTTAIITLRNTSEQQTTGAVITALLKNANPAFQVAIPSGTILEKDNDVHFTVTFAPVTDGSFADTLLIQLQPCDILKAIPLSGVRAQAIVSRTSEEIVLTAQPIGNAINAQVLFRNSSTASVPVLAVDGIAPPFTLVGTQPALPALLPPDSTLTITVQYTANDTIPDSTHVHLVFNTPCSGTTDSTRLIGNGISSSHPRPIALTASLPPALTGSPGEEISVPIALTSPSIDTAQVTAVETQLVYNGSLLLPLSATAGPIAPGFSTTISEQRPGVARLVVKHPSTALTGEGTLVTVRFRVLLGNALSTVLALDTLAVTAAVEARTATENAVFTLVDSCEIASRLLDVSGATSVAVIGQQYDALLVETHAAYDGASSLVLYDALGRPVFTASDPQRKAGAQQHVVPTSALPDGVYFLVLHTGNTFKTAQFSLIR